MTDHRQPGIYELGDDRPYFAVNEGIPKGHPDYIVSRSDLVAVARCPQEWIEAPEVQTTEAMRVGSIVDALLMQPTTVSERYWVKPAYYVNDKGEEKAWNGNAKQCREMLADVEKDGREVISRDTWERCETMAANLADRHIADLEDTIGHYLSTCKHQVMAVADIDGIRCRILVDAVPPVPEAGLIDVKTTASLPMDEWAAHCARFAYHLQAAMYLDVYNAAEGTDRRRTMTHLIVGNQPPHLTAAREMSEEFLSVGRGRWRRALATYRRCVESGEWPGYSPDGVEVTEPPAWEVKRWREEW